jgi:hypothetical protein
MEDVSNKTIVALLAIALVVTVVGTIVSVSKLGALGGQYSVLTGAVTGTGTTSVTLAGNAGITVDDNAVTFGSGYVDPQFVSATLDSSLAIGSWTGWINLTATNIDSMLVNNTGTNFLRLNISSETTTHAEDWLCTGDSCTSNSALLQVKATNFEANACTGSGAIQSAYTNLLQNASKVTVPLCTEMDFQTAADTMNVFFKATVPNDAGTGAHSVTLTFTAIDSTV